MRESEREREREREREIDREWGKLEERKGESKSLRNIIKVSKKRKRKRGRMTCHLVG